MALITCPDCTHQVSDVAPACPRCGRPVAPLQVEQTGKRYKGMMAFGFIGCVLGLLLSGVASVAGWPLWPSFLLAMACLCLYLWAIFAAWWRHG